jgi:hypothetical protein
MKKLLAALLCIVFSASLSFADPYEDQQRRRAMQREIQQRQQAQPQQQEAQKQQRELRARQDAEQMCNGSYRGYGRHDLSLRYAYPEIYEQRHKECERLWKIEDKKREEQAAKRKQYNQEHINEAIQFIKASHFKNQGRRI